MPPSTRTAALFAATLLLPLAAYGQYDSDFDGTFAGDGRFAYGGSAGTIHHPQAAAVATAPDGATIVALTTTSPTTTILLARHLSNGLLDTTWGSFQGMTLLSASFGTTNYQDRRPVALLIQPDGKIVIGVRLSEVLDLGPFSFGLMRVDADGTPDPTFGASGSILLPFSGAFPPDDFLADLVQTPTGLLVVGTTRWLGDDFDLAIARLSTDGVLDPTFSGDGKAVVAFDAVPGGADEAIAVVPDGDGMIVLARVVTATSLSFGLVRIDGQGLVDPTWGPNGTGKIVLEGTPGVFCIDNPTALLRHPSGDLIVVGTTNSASVPWNQPVAFRRTATGAPFSAWGAEGRRILPLVDADEVDFSLVAALLDSTGERVLWAGEANFGGGLIAPVAGRFSALSAEPDPGFNETGLRFYMGGLGAVTEGFSAATLASADRLVLGGWSWDESVPPNGHGSAHLIALEVGRAIFTDGFETGATNAWQ